MTIDRRRFLLAGAGAVAVGCANDAPGPDHPRRAPVVTTTPRPDGGARRRVVVVGAGLAGLTAGLVLRSGGWEVVIVEARARLGGRVRTLGREGDETAGAFGADLDGVAMIAEGGGESIDDGHVHIRRWVSQLGLQTQQRLPDREPTALIVNGGRRRSGAQLLAESGGRVGDDYGRADDAIAGLVGDADPSDLSTWSNAEELDAQDTATFLDSLRLDPMARFAVESDLRSSYNCELVDLSLLMVAQQEALTPAGGEETMRVLGGNSGLVAAMADRITGAGGTIRTASPVGAIRRSGDLATVELSSGEAISARHVVLALPPPPLRSIRFEPSLPSSVAAAVDGIDLGTTVKVSTRYDRRPWAADGYSGLTVSDLDYRIAWDATDGVGERTVHRGRLRVLAARPGRADVDGLAGAGRQPVVRRRAHRGPRRLHGECGPIRGARRCRHRPSVTVARTCGADQSTA